MSFDFIVKVAPPKSLNRGRFVEGAKSDALGAVLDGIGRADDFDDEFLPKGSLNFMVIASKKERWEYVLPMKREDANGMPPLVFLVKKRPSRKKSKIPLPPVKRKEKQRNYFLLYQKRYYFAFSETLACHLMFTIETMISTHCFIFFHFAEFHHAHSSHHYPHLSSLIARCSIDGIRCTAIFRPLFLFQHTNIHSPFRQLFFRTITQRNAVRTGFSGDFLTSGGLVGCLPKQP
jgi:hypothetical protein